MPALPSLLIAASASIFLVLGALHLYLTFSGKAFEPRDTALLARMQEVSPRISKETTIWRACLGFHDSHSVGAMLFGLVYGYLALAQAPVLFGSAFLLALGFAFLAGFTVLGRRYWFRTPFRGIAIALAFYVAALVAQFA
jgi:hypothetical protein